MPKLAYPFCRILCACLANFFITSLSLGSSLPKAIAAYDQGQFAEAARHFEAMAQTHENGHLYYNLGNSYYRLGARGKAIAAFLAARRLLPRDPDIKANLAFIAEQNTDRLSYEPGPSLGRSLAFWETSVSLRELLFAGSLCLSLGFLLLIPTLWRASWAFCRQLSIAGLTLGCFCFLALMVSLAIDQRWGAVSQAKAIVRSGPGSHNTPVFELHEGAPFQALAAEAQWLRIRLADGKMGWIARQDIALYAWKG